jgi:large subunit ribosomal protein L25
MKSLEIIGFKRANLGKKNAQQLRQDAMVPCVLYGGSEQVHFHVPMIMFRDLVYSPSVYEARINIDGTTYRAVLQDYQMHPVSEVLLHADFLELQDGKEVKMEVPVKFVGASPGVLAGGTLVTKLRKLKVKALPENLPDFVEVNISELELGKSIKVGKVEENNFRILSDKLAPVATVTIPRGLRSQMEDEKKASGKK